MFSKYYIINFYKHLPKYLQQENSFSQFKIQVKNVLIISKFFDMQEIWNDWRKILKNNTL